MEQSEVKIFNIREFCRKVNEGRKKPFLNLYPRTTEFMKGARYKLTPEMQAALMAQFEADVVKFREFMAGE